jgi:uncharacterized damage-inducible protein DinB
VALADSLLPDLDHETAVTRQLIERVPEPDLGWAPHAKSDTLGGLAVHLARLLAWGQAILAADHHDLSNAGGRSAAAPGTTADILALFDRNAAAIRRDLAGRSDAELAAPWELRRGRQVIMSLPKAAALRRFVIHHLIHHRGQMTVYLRLRDVPLPPIYGSSADEPL